MFRMLANSIEMRLAENDNLEELVQSRSRSRGEVEEEMTERLGEKDYVYFEEADNIVVSINNDDNDDGNTVKGKGKGRIKEPEPKEKAKKDPRNRKDE